MVERQNAEQDDMYFHLGIESDFKYNRNDEGGKDHEPVYLIY